MFFAYFIACNSGPSVAPPVSEEPAFRERSAAEFGIPTACELVSSCEEIERNVEDCVAIPAAFELDVVEGEVVAIDLAEGAVALGVPFGPRFTVFASSTGLCSDALIFDFEVQP